MAKITKNEKKRSASISLVTMEIPTHARKSLPINLNEKAAEKITVSGLEADDSLDVSELLEILIEIKNGNFEVKMPVNKTGISGKISDTINEIIDSNKKLINEFAEAKKNIGKEGRLDERIISSDAHGEWKTGIDSLNLLISDLVYPIREIHKVISSVAKGNMANLKPIDISNLDQQGEFARIAEEVNCLVKQLNLFSSEVTRVASEIGKGGKLGGQAVIHGIEGNWKELTDAINQMSSIHSARVDIITKVLNDVANGDLSQKITLDIYGDAFRLKDTLNLMVDQLRGFASEVTRVACEVGVEGRLGAQANIPGALGVWKNITENVNQFADNFTIQVRSISEVAAAVTKGDLTRYVSLDAKGEVRDLKDTINLMISNLRQTTLLSRDLDWLKSNLAKFNKMLQGQKDLKTVGRRILSELAQVINAHYGAFYIVTADEVFPKLKLFASYAYKSEKHIPKEFMIGEGLIGQCALDKERIIISNVPDTYVKITSGLGKAKPSDLILLPVLFENNVKAVIELGSFETFSRTQLDFLSQLTESIGIVVNTIQTTNRTEVLLSQSQSLASALKIQQEELKRTNDELEDKAFLLSKQKDEVETKNREVEEARKSLEEKAEQLTLTSKYKTEFLANMSHELRTPLNSLLILSQQLYENPEGNLNVKQTSYAKTIFSCGDDLLQLINNILDLSKIESGFLIANISKVRFTEISEFLESTFNPLAESKKLKFITEIDPGLPESLNTDFLRLNQILKNLLSNAFKFTEKGEVKLKIFITDRKWKSGKSSLNNANQVAAFSITDSGIGIPKDKQSIIFEAFQQAEGNTSRKYGGTGLGLSISRGLADLLGGTIELESNTGIGTTFTFYLPLDKIDDSAGDNYFEPSQLKQKDLEEIINSFKIVQDEIKDGKQDEIIEITNETCDDRNNISANDKVLLIIEDDLLFAKILSEHAHLAGIKVVIASNYAEIFNFITLFNPIAVTLDVYLSDTNGWKVMDVLKNDLKYRHIPVYMISNEENKILALKRGARNFLFKPVQKMHFNDLFKDIIEFNAKEKKQLLVVEYIENEPSQITKLFNECCIELTTASTGKEAIQLLKENIFDCIILDYSLPDILGIDLVKNIENNIDNLAPIILYSAKDLNKGELTQLNKMSGTVVLKDVNSRDRLLEETLMLLHVDYAKLPLEKRRMMENFRMKSDVLIRKKILVVDDDVRNLFAVTAVFERYNIDVLTAQSGKEAISMLNEFSDIDMVLMDIMMPEMDGYEAISKIRRENKNSALPIIAVTAKAMTGDRQKCIAAGASDYITKPLKMDQLLSMMRMWFHK